MWFSEHIRYILILLIISCTLFFKSEYHGTGIFLFKLMECGERKSVVLHLQEASYFRFATLMKKLQELKITLNNVALECHNMKQTEN